MSKSLAVQYRPSDWDEVVEQDNIKKILQNQLSSGEVRNSYLFVGGAGTGKTTCARILAKEINHGTGSAIEIDGASNNGVDQVREINNQAKTRSVDSEYKIFIIDECHMITTAGWNAMLKLIEEPPAKTIFIFCTTNPEKIPKTILSRVQRYDFQRISTEGIYNRLIAICNKENIQAEENALMHIAKLADGHMRDALTMLDKTVAYDSTITELNITSALGLNSYYDINVLFDAVTQGFEEGIISSVETCHNEGRELKQLIDDEISFVLDYIKWQINHSLHFCSCPSFVEEWFKQCKVSKNHATHLLDALIDIKNTIKYDSSPKTIIEAMLILESEKLKGEK